MHLDIVVGSLEAAQLVHRVAEEVGTLQFKHALTQESAYDSLLKSKRSDLHGQVARAYEDLFPEQMDDLAAQLSQHYAAAGQPAKTFEYATRAGQVAARRYANPEARFYFSQALDALASLPDDEAHRRMRVDAVVRLVGVSLRFEGPHRSLVRLEQAESLAVSTYGDPPAARDDRLDLARLRYWMAQALLHGNQTRRAIEKLEGVLAIARADRDPELLALPESMLGRAYAVLGDFRRAQTHLESANRSVDQMSTNHEAIMARGMLGWTLTERGNAAEGRALGEHVYSMAVQSGSLTARSLSGMCLALNTLAAGENERALELALEMLQASEAAGDLLIIGVGNGIKAWAQCRLGHVEAAHAASEIAHRIAEQAGGRLASADMYESAAAEIELRSGQADRAIEIASQVAESAQASRDLYAAGLAHRVWGAALAALEPPRYDQAAAHFDTSLSSFEEGDAKLQAAQTRVAWGKMLMDQGDGSAATELIGRASEQFKSSGLAREEESARQLLVGLS